MVHKVSMRETLREKPLPRVDADDGKLVKIQQVWFPPLNGVFFSL